MRPRRIPDCFTSQISGQTLPLTSPRVQCPFSARIRALNGKRRHAASRLAVRWQLAPRQCVSRTGVRAGPVCSSGNVQGVAFGALGPLGTLLRLACAFQSGECRCRARCWATGLRVISGCSSQLKTEHLDTLSVPSST